MVNVISCAAIALYALGLGKVLGLGPACRPRGLSDSLGAIEDRASFRILSEET